MCIKLGDHLVRFSVIIGLALMSLVLWDSALVSQGAQARQGVRSAPSVCAWKQRDWSSMSSAQRQLWSRLGWTQTRWDSDNPKMAPSSESKSWAHLSASERNAASQLGFSQSNWEVACRANAQPLDILDG
jgi:hypothetical protein